MWHLRTNHYASTLDSCQFPCEEPDMEALILLNGFRSMQSLLFGDVH